MKEKILELIELKIRLMEYEKEHQEEVDKCVENGSYYFAEGGTTTATERIRELEQQIEDLEL